MNILQIIYLLEIRKQRSISKAAEALYVSQPAVSHQILKLEEELGIPLLQRSPHGVMLTAMGKCFCDQAELVMEQWTALESKAQELRTSRPSVSISVWLGPFVYNHNCFDPIVQFLESQPHVDFSVCSSFEAAGNLYEEIAEGHIDIAIDRAPPIYMAKEPWKYKATVVHREPACVMVSRNHPLSMHKVLTVDDLQPYVPISFAEGTAINNIQRQVYHDLEISEQKLFHFQSVSNSMDMLRRGKCYGIGQRQIAESNDLVAIPFMPTYYITQSFICLSENSAHPVYASFCRFIRRLFRDSAFTGSDPDRAGMCQPTDCAKAEPHNRP